MVILRERKLRWIAEHFTWGEGGGGGGGYMVGADILSSADWYHHSIIYKFKSIQYKLAGMVHIREANEK